MAYSINQITVTTLDAVQWISKAWNMVTNMTICNAFLEAGFSSPASAILNSSDGVMFIDSSEDQNPIKQLDDLLTHLNIRGNRMSAEQLVHID
ncbi:unnamed protein product [Rotaria sp. Silwood1]|nr:unnamed protein product [Rotaria sp. Silwood1]CAF3606536.1 unnamed protein product [Rotaria sp. Silwood1]CAF3620878.1 unnamed protein product [Rotaria sp. Silwood1]CAF4608001.1 unnamed protein product [Rotaria sp. Silwood1]CAF5030145.1 unnamed protein product [Rotaria sp. Silwood1]